MTRLTATLCLTIAVLLGSAGMSWGAYFDCKMNDGTPVTIVYGDTLIEPHYLTTVDKNGDYTKEKILGIPIQSFGLINYKEESLDLYVNQLRTNHKNLVGYFKDPHDTARLLSVVVSFMPIGGGDRREPITIFVPTPGAQIEKGFCKIQL